MRPAEHGRGEGGFALVLTLVVILVLSLLTEIMSRWVSAALDNAFANREEVDAKRKLGEAIAISVYILGTRPLSFRGIEFLTIARLRPTARPETVGGFDPAADYIRLDSHPYSLDGAELRFQDARGLIALNRGSADDLSALLGLLGVAADDRGPLIAKLQDYVDADSLVRLNGAEARQYADAGREPPANAPLRTPWEVRRVLDWDKIKGIAQEDTPWGSLTTTAPIDGFNVNTAPRALLSLMPGINEAGVDNVIRWRRDQPIMTGYQFGSLAGLPIPQGPSRFLGFPANMILITLSAPYAPLERRLAIRLSPQLRDHPWTIEYDLEMPRTVRDEKQLTANALPLPALLSPIP
jgi:hypothetical protein